MSLPNLHYIRIVRRHKIRQAVSFLIAARTSRWLRLASQDGPTAKAARRLGIETGDQVPSGWSLADVQAELANPPQRLVLLNEIENRLGAIDGWTAEWDRFFNERQVVPLTVEYEDLVADSAAVVGRVLRFLGLDAAARVEGLRSPLLPQSDQRNTALVAAYAAWRATGC
jgi:LPS sulfotransferase NodH